MPAIEICNLCKSFSTKYKEPGLMGSLKAVIAPQYKSIEAVKGVSFSVDAGELLAFIGPNGAGKSTTIKILTGILYPSEGDASVLGLVPWKEHGRLACRIGCVFGQKPQLWYHLPPADTFHLFAHIYELEGAAFRKHLDWKGLGELVLVAGVFIMTLSVVFRKGLRKYESGSAINVNM